ncbi:MAG: hypothetical protein MJE77_36415 [Proteobacteria bacterium]|nr:hypothetical protein [Pseudomonadota bacterium]
MHDIIRRYLGDDSVEFINSASLLFFRNSPHRLRELGGYSLYYLRKGRIPRTKFVILAQGRTGSTLLVDLMNSHPDVFTFGEIFQRDVVSNVKHPRLFAEGLLSLSKKPCAGFKVKLRQMEVVQNQDVHATMVDFHKHGWKIIYLKRTNLVSHAISDLRSEKTGLYHSVVPTKNGSGRSRPQVHIDLDELMETLKFQEWCLVKEKRALHSVPHLTMEYERDLLTEEAQRDSLSRVYGYLGLASHQANTEFRKVTSRKLSDSVENFAELAEALSKTEYARFLDTAG